MKGLKTGKYGWFGWIVTVLMVGAAIAAACLCCCNSQMDEVMRPSAAMIAAERSDMTAAEERAPVLRPPRRNRSVEDALQNSTSKFLQTHSHLANFDPKIT